MVAHFATRLDHHLRFLEYGLALIRILILLLLLDTALSLSKGTLTLDLLLHLRLVNAKPRRSQLCKKAWGCTALSLWCWLARTAPQHKDIWFYGVRREGYRQLQHAGKG